MLVVSCRVTMRLLEAHSLKDKRQVVQSVLRRLRDRHNVSALEIEELDRWQTAVLGLAMVALDRADAEQRLQHLRREVEESTGLKYVEFEPEWL